MITALPRIALAVADYEAAVDLFETGFGLPFVDFSPQTVPDLGAHVGLCVPDGGSNIELMAPADPTKPLSQSLQKFLDTRGEGFYALMLEAPDPDTEAALLRERGADVLPLMAGAGGRDVHPRSIHGVLVRVYPDRSVRLGSRPPSRSPNLGGISRAIVATADAVAAGATYRSVFELATDEPITDPRRGVRSVRCRAPEGGDIEFVSCTDASMPFGRAVADAASVGGGLFALGLGSSDPAAARAVLTDRGMVFDGPGHTTSVLGARIFIDDEGNHEQP